MEKSVEVLIQEIYADSRVTPSEVLRLRAKIEESSEILRKSVGSQGLLDAFCKSIDVSVQLMQETLLSVKRGEYSKHANDIFHFLEAYIAYLKVTFDAFK
jgi:hypothetical protein